MAEKKHHPSKIPQSRNEIASWIFPRFHHRDPKIRKNHKIKSSLAWGFLQNGWKSSNKTQKVKISWISDIFAFPVRCVFCKIQTWKTLFRGDRWRKSWKIHGILWEHWLMVRAKCTKYENEQNYFKKITNAILLWQQSGNFTEILQKNANRMILKANPIVSKCKQNFEILKCCWFTLV